MRKLVIIALRAVLLMCAINLFAFAMFTDRYENFVFGTSTAGAQSAPLTTPKTYATANTFVVRAFSVDDRTQSASVTIAYTTDGTGTVEREPARIDIPANPASPGTEYTDFLTAIGTAATGETGTVRRRANFRIVHYICTTAARIQCASETP